MQTAALSPAHAPFDGPGSRSATRAIHVGPCSPLRPEAESFIRDIFHRHYGALVSSIAPNLFVLEKHNGIAATVGWRGADYDSLFLERYLDAPIEAALENLTGQRVERRHIVEAGNLASRHAGGSVQVIIQLARHLADQGYEWVVFTATRQLIGIFTKLGLPLLALTKADPSRLGAEASEWGTYYKSDPVVVAGRIRLALERNGAGA
jgi:hypothetical protein